ncbi:hypothetical protein EJB05_35194, partial [Eragrostis curvula]
MEAMLQSLDASGHPRTIGTYNAVIAGYLTAWMWDKMEEAFCEMESGPVPPDATTHLLMLRGYAHAGMIYKMESAYERALKHAGKVDIVHIRAMICAYCKSEHVDRIQKIEELLQRLGPDDYRPWLNVLLIRVYAQEGLVDAMEQRIAEALDRNSIVTTAKVMRSIISSYFKCDAVDKLANFVRQAEESGWKLCRSLYHCKMVMYGKHHRLEEMHGCSLVLCHVKPCHLHELKPSLTSQGFNDGCGRLLSQLEDELLCEEREVVITQLFVCHSGKVKN